jgi:hypothetical protein
MIDASLSRRRWPRIALWLAAAAAAAALAGCKSAAHPPGATDARAPATRVPAPQPPAAAAGEAARVHRAAAAQDMQRVRQQRFDREKAAEHRALLAFVEQARAQLDDAAARLKGKRDAARRLERLQATQRPAIAARTQALQALDPTGQRSHLTPAHETNLNFVADEYPAALIGALAGDPQPLAEVRAEMERVRKEMEAWLAQVAGL